MKAWKLVQVVGVLAILIGVAIRTSTGEYYGTFAAVIGVLIFSVGRVMTWLKSDRP